jgi:hypothetical protein
MHNHGELSKLYAKYIMPTDTIPTKQSQQPTQFTSSVQATTRLQLISINTLVSFT